jgi:hypothetical protein
MPDNHSFPNPIYKVVNMVGDRALRDRIGVLELDLVNVMWEDTARTPGSVWGDNISDMTLQVRYPDFSPLRELLPVIRYPNFTDKTGDVRLDLIKLKVGNENGTDLQVISLKEYLENLENYISYPNKFHLDNQPLLTDRDTHALVSAQACFLPISSAGKCSFNPVLFNYQSRYESPAVLAILISPEGTSATTIDNSEDLAKWGQNLYFNHHGQKTCFIGRRLSDYIENQTRDLAARQAISFKEARSQITVAEDINMMMVVQVPLKHKQLKYSNTVPSVSTCSTENDLPIFLSKKQQKKIKQKSLPRAKFCRSDVEDAAIGYGKDEGEHRELGGHKLERDERYPIRVTVQFYKATSNGIINDRDLVNIHDWIEIAYSSADYLGSLVVGTLEKGDLGMDETRPTQPVPSPQAVLSPPQDYLEIVNPFGDESKIQI